MRIDQEARTIHVSVREIVERDSRSTPLAPLRDRADTGRQVHADIGKRRVRERPGYRCEVPLRGTLTIGGYRVTLQGRADGIDEQDGRPVVEEYKSVAIEPFELTGTSAWDFPAARMQLGIYLYLLHLDGENPAGGRIVVQSIFGGGEAWVVSVDPFHDEVAAYVESRVLEFIIASERRAARVRRRRESASSLPFAFPEHRPIQVSMKEEIEDALDQGRNLLLEAPTGSGKTAAVAHALLQTAFQAGATVFYATAKTSGQAAVMETIRRMNDRGADITAIRLTARAKVCPEDEVTCRPELCPRLRNYTALCARTGVKERLLDLRCIDREALVQHADDVGICPFRLGLELADVADVVVGDYNYVFSPGAYLFELFEGRERTWFLAIDEAHNLPGRAREYYSSTLSWRATNLIASWAEQQGEPIASRLARLVTDIQGYIWEALEQTGLTETAEGRARHRPDAEQVVSWRRTLGRVLASAPLRHLADRDWSAFELPYRFYKQLASFVDGVLQLDETSSSIVERAEGDARLRIIAHDPSKRLAKRLNQFEFVVAMSATLSPEGFYRDMLGMGDAQWAAFASPFPKERCTRFVVGDLPDRFHQRNAAIPDYVDVVRTVVEAKSGVYALYVSSHAFLEALVPHLRGLDVSLHVQRRDMDDGVREALLRQLCRQPKDVGTRSRLLVAVLGGSFAEGIECPPGVLSGVIVLGPGLPAVCLEQEMLRDYFEDRFGTGFEYAYVYPGMTRVIQAAGRLIRRASDRGCVVLVGERFLEPLYAKALPRSWYVSKTAELATGDLQGDLEAFWHAVEPSGQSDPHVSLTNDISSDE